MIRTYWLEKLRSILCMVTYSGHEIVLDPVYFLERALKRIGYSGQRLNSLFEDVKYNSSRSERLRKTGRHREFLAYANSSAVRGLVMYFAVRDVEEELEELTAEITESVRGVKFTSSNLRILHYLTNSTPYTRSGYTERSESVLSSQRAAGLSPSAVTRFGYPAVIGKLQSRAEEQLGGVKIFRLVPALFPWSRRRYRQQAVRELVRLIEKESIDILHTTSAFTNAIVASEAAEVAGIPWVYEVRGQLESTWLSRLPRSLQDRARQSDKYRYSQSQEIKAMNAAGGVVLLSETQKDSLISRGLSNSNIAVIPNALDETLDPERSDGRAVRRVLGIEGKRVVGIVSSLVSYEGIETLLRAGAIAGTQPVLLIVGDGDDLPRLKALAKLLRIEDRVFFPGKVGRDKVLDWYGAMDVFVVPRIDSEVTRVVTPLKALKAQALGIPVIASDLPALREVTGGYAQFFEAGNFHELAQLLDQPLDKVQEARNFAANRNWKANGEKYVDLYSNL